MKEMFGSGVELACREDDRTAYCLAYDSGDAVMTSCEVFPGMALVHDDVHTRQCSVDQVEAGDVIELKHCREGRIECELQTEFHELSPGDMDASPAGYSKIV